MPEDNRCPIDVDCIWPGKATIELQVLYRGEHMGLYFTYTAGVGSKVEIGDHVFEVLALAPEPVSDDPIQPDEYRIRLGIRDLRE